MIIKETWKNEVKIYIRRGFTDRQHRDLCRLGLDHVLSDSPLNSGEIIPTRSLKELNRAKGHMFKSVGWTWNPVRGCTHGCGISADNPKGYCWARAQHERYGRTTPFEEATLSDKILNEKFPNDGTWILVSSTGDLFCPGVPHDWINLVLDRIAEKHLQPGLRSYNTFLLPTKNPNRFFKFWPKLKDLRDDRRIVLGTTIETNRLVPGHAPPTIDRYLAMSELHRLGFRTFLSLEPLADFDLQIMIHYIRGIEPEHIEMGLENYTQILPKPPMDKIKTLYNKLKDLGYDILLKTNIAHLET
jgi:DNA repair photolyase